MSKLNIRNIRYFNNIKIVDGGKNVIKSYIGNDKYYKDKFYDEIIWMIKAQTQIKDYVPKIIDYSLDRNNLWMKYNIIDLHTIHDFFVNDKLLNWNLLRETYEKFIKQCSEIKPEIFISNDWRDKMINFYLERTYNNLLKIKNKEKLRAFFNYDHIYINDEKFPSLKYFLNMLKDKIQKLRKEESSNNADIFNKLVSPSENRIFLTHLDLIFGNVFFDEKNNKIKVIDPRGSFADSKDFGDIYYDYAKIYQSIYGLYDFIVEDRFEIKKTHDNHFFIKINEPKNIEEIREAFAPIFPQNDIEVIKLLESLQFFAMTPAHNDNVNRQIIQLCTGIMHLTEVLGLETWK
ncbi:MAG: hypothetical protein HDR43_01915 [Mycoplasma sp.]|nr:hypothetical protein [Mycoplasma sp.]